MNPWLVILIAVVVIVASFWLAAEIDVRWRAHRREHGLRRIYDEAQREADAERELRNGGASRNLW